MWEWCIDHRYPRFNNLIDPTHDRDYRAARHFIGSSDKHGAAAENMKWVVCHLIRWDPCVSTKEDVYPSAEAWPSPSSIHLQNTFFLSNSHEQRMNPRTRETKVRRRDWRKEGRRRRRGASAPSHGSQQHPQPTHAWSWFANGGSIMHGEGDGWKSLHDGIEESLGGRKVGSSTSCYGSSQISELRIFISISRFISHLMSFDSIPKP